MNHANPLSPRRLRSRPIVRRGFNLVELLIALAISATLLAATMVALRASFMAYQATTEQASTHTIGRLTMERLQSMIRTGENFGPFPINPKDSIVESDSISFETPGGQVLRVEWRGNDTPAVEALYVIVDPGGAGEAEHLLLEGVVTPTDPDTGLPLAGYHPFTLEYKLGRVLYRATIDLTLNADDNMSVEIEGKYARQIRLVASAMPRMAAFDG